MLLLYSIAYTLGFIVMLPAFLLRREKYASGFRERLGNYPEFKHDGRKVIWLHCVSVGETNAARPLVDALIEQFPSHRIVVSTTTKTGQELGKTIFTDKADAVFYFPFDWKFSVRRALRNFRPSLILLMETEIWPRLIVEAKRSGARVAIVNGRLSEKSFRRYSKVLRFIRRVLGQIGLALMQGEKDVERIKSLGIDASKTHVTGNIKFDISTDEGESELTEYFRERFGIDGEKPLIVAASTHDQEEGWVLDALEVSGWSFRVLFAPRHPERFDEVASMLSDTQYSMVRRSDQPSDTDKTADVILLDSIGELRAVYPLADIVFVGGSLIPHGGQSVLEGAIAGKPIVIGPYTDNFRDVISKFLECDALIQTDIPLPADQRPSDPSGLPLPPVPGRDEWSELYFAIRIFLDESGKRAEYGGRALQVMNLNRGATARTIEFLSEITDN
jgi:3-deoxy-D-manno-octulosonic-acid transferase